MWRFFRNKVDFLSSDLLAASTFALDAPEVNVKSNSQDGHPLQAEPVSASLITKLASAAMANPWGLLLMNEMGFDTAICKIFFKISNFELRIFLKTGF
jgi:hypothetical protein